MMDLLKKVEWFEKLALEFAQDYKTNKTSEEAPLKSKRQERMMSIAQIIKLK